MAKISNTTAYPNITPQGTDYLVLTDTSDSNATKTLTVDALVAYIDGNLNYDLQQVLDAGNTATEDINLTGDINLAGDISGSGNIVRTGNITLTGNYIGVGNITNQGNLTLTAGTAILPVVDIGGGSIDNTAIGVSAANRAIFASSGTSEAIRAVSFNTLAPALWIQTGGLKAKDVAGTASYGNDGDVLISKGSGGTTSDQVPRWTAQSEIEPHQVLKTVENQTGVVLVKGTPVKLDSNPVGTPRVIAADAGPVSQMPASGLVYEDIANGSEGKIILIGNLTNVSVAFSGTAPSIGDITYVSETTGELTVDRPSDSASLVQNVGIVSRTAGQIDIQVTCTGRSNDLPNLDAQHIFIGSNTAPNIGQPVSSSLISINDSSPALPNFDITIGNPTPTSTIIQGRFYGNVVHPYGAGNLSYGEESLINPALTGTSNTAIGLEALRNLTSGENNTALGAQALRNQTIGSNNVGIGISALFNSTQGEDNIAIGVNASGNTVDSIRNIAIGTEALRNVTGNTNNQNIAIGWRSADALTAGEKNVVIGAQALGIQSTASSFSTIVGESAGGNVNIVAGMNQSVLVGFEAGWGATDDRTTAIGYQAGRVNDGAANVWVGREAGVLNTGNGNTFIGSQVGTISTTSAASTIIGSGAAANLTIGNEETIIGERAGATLVDGSLNVIIGRSADINDPAGNEAVIIGDSAIGPGSSTVIGQGANANHPEQVIIGAGATGAGIPFPMIAFSSGMGSSYGLNTAALQFPDNGAALAGGLPVGAIYVVGPTGGAVSNPATLAIVTP